MAKFALAIAALAAASTAQAQDIGAPAKAALEPRIAALVSALRSGDSQKAIADFFASSKMLETNNPSLTSLANQLSNGVAIYGRVTSCAPVGWRRFSEIVVNYQMVCAHEKYATRWKLTFGKLEDGWSSMALIFDDDVDEGPFD